MSVNACSQQLRIAVDPTIMGRTVTSECHNDVSLEENVLSFTRDHWPIPRRHKLSLETRIAHDLGMDGDDAVEFFKDFGEKFNVDFADLRWDRHFAPEGGGSLGALIVLCLCVTAGFWLHELFGLLPAWGWGIVLIGAAFWIHQRWFANDKIASDYDRRFGGVGAFRPMG
jgi:hypothetical protein